MHDRQSNVPIIYLLTILIFGFISILVTFPLANGDEGYHLSKAYQIFSASFPDSMAKDTVRQIELKAVGLTESIENFDVDRFNKEKLPDVSADGIRMNMLRDDNAFIKVDIAHFPAAIGVLLGRLVYPSYGVMLLFGRLFNLLFFSFAMYLIIKASKIGKWTLFVLFSVPFIQKIASPSYDVLAYVGIAAFSVNFFELASVASLNEISKKKWLYTVFTIILVLFTKKNYIFILTLLIFLIFKEMNLKKVYQSLTVIKKVFAVCVLLVAVIAGLYFLNLTFDLVQFSKLFFHNYLNVAAAGRRGKTLFTVVPTILPDLFNIIWILGTFIVIVGEKGTNWNKYIVWGSFVTFFVNWVGIYAGFYLIHHKGNTVFDELSGRYLSPFLICFVPLAQYYHEKYSLEIPEHAIKKVAISITWFIMLAYLLLVYYRGYVIHVTPTWSNG